MEHNAGTWDFLTSLVKRAATLKFVIPDQFFFFPSGEEFICEILFWALLY